MHAMSRRVAILVFDGVQSLDLAGPLEVLSLAGRLAESGSAPYTVETVAPAPGPIESSSGLHITPDATIAEHRRRLDTLIVAGGSGTRAAAADAATLMWLRGAAARARRVASVCTGAFLLARAGLLDGRRATTHWASCNTLARRYPRISVEPDPIFVRDGDIITSAGVTAGIDMTLALVEEDLGAEVALRVARELVLFVRRPGGQRQFSTALGAQTPDRGGLAELRGWMAEHLDGDLSVPTLAGRLHVSERHLSRLFAAELGTTPGACVEEMRVERARLLLETGDAQLAEIARCCGFRTVETLRRSFARRLGVSPRDYRLRFARSAA